MKLVSKIIISMTISIVLVLLYIQQENTCKVSKRKFTTTKITFKLSLSKTLLTFLFFKIKYETIYLKTVFELIDVLPL